MTVRTGINRHDFSEKRTSASADDVMYVAQDSMTGSSEGRTAKRDRRIFFQKSPVGILKNPEQQRETIVEMVMLRCSGAGYRGAALVQVKGAALPSKLMCASTCTGYYLTHL